MAMFGYEIYKSKKIKLERIFWLCDCQKASRYAAVNESVISLNDCFPIHADKIIVDLELTLVYDNTIAVLPCQHIYTLVKTNSF